MGNDVSNFFSNDLKSMEDWVSGVGAGIKDTMNGLTGQGWNYANAGRDFKNYGDDVKNAFTGGHSRVANPNAAQEESLKNYQRSINPNTPFNKQNWQSYSTNISNSVYGSRVGNDNVKPSDLMKISNPSAKMAVASTRGAKRATVNMMGARVDNSMADTLSGQPSMASDTTNAGGGEGHATSVDMDNDQFKEPNTAPTGTSPTNDDPVATEDAQGGHTQPNASSRL
jgi:hypothetical protein